MSLALDSPAWLVLAKLTDGGKTHVNYGAVFKRYIQAGGPNCSPLLLEAVAKSKVESPKVINRGLAMPCEYFGVRA